MRASHVNNHFGFGRHALAITFIHPHLFSKTRGRMYKTVLHQQQSLAFIISICLLLSGNIHQCPGPVSAPTRTGPRVSSIYSRSNTGNLQVCSSCTHCYALEQPTELPASVSSADAVDLPVVGVVAAVGALEGECGLFRRNGVFCGGSRSALEGSQLRCCLPCSVGVMMQVVTWQFENCYSHKFILLKVMLTWVA
ncbi:hypothetical protein PO909_015550 [Leuciscus waleckii]